MHVSVHEGHLPFRYLGVPITSGRMSKGDCNILVEKLVSRIRSFRTKKLSYSGRLVLVNSVLTAIYSYWINIFVIPKGVLNKVYAICKKFLWDASPDYIKVLESAGLRSVPQRVKEVWVYIKGRNWDEYTPSGDLSWGWKSICKVKEKLAPGYHNGQWLLDTKGYTMESGYDLLRDKFQTVQWHRMVWNRWEALMLKDKLFALGIAADDLCLLCGAGTESHYHLFQSCPYSRKVLGLFDNLTGTSYLDANLLSWIEARKFSDLKTGVLLCAAMALYYHLWLQRNIARIEGSILKPELLRDIITKELRFRLNTLIKPGIQCNDRNWLRSVNLYV
ncbi:uncharacterized protein LOC141588260 [Silene latifolia]|uniref:uncharacterized protein LOC141588260 n=1 Tax=Silene latifolia TaxID=37657 RepID=UPI003D77665E